MSLSSLGPCEGKRSLREVVVFYFTGVGSTTLSKIGVVVTFEGRLVVAFEGRLVVVFVGRLPVVSFLVLARADFTAAILMKPIIEKDFIYLKINYMSNGSEGPLDSSGSIQCWKKLEKSDEDDDADYDDL